MKNTFLLIITFATSFSMANAQIETPENQIIIEDAVDQIGEETDFNFDTEFENLGAYANKQLNLNRANEDDFKAFGLLNPIQIQSLLTYRNDVGDFISIYELQAIPNFDLDIIQQILPYVSVGNGLIGKEDFLSRLTKGDATIYTRFRRVLEAQEGYETDKDNAYLGDKNQYYFRFRYNYDTRLSYGITMEKDPGEDFFSGSNPQGFDYMSAHFYARDLSKNIKTVAIGDYKVSLGQGLTMWSGFGFGKSAAALNTKRQSIPILPYTSVNENLFQRGAAATFSFNQFSLTTFVSSRNLDANISSIDTSNFEEDVQAISAFQISGFHRNKAEIEDEKAVRQLLYGGSLAYKLRRGKIALNSVYAKYNATIETNDNLYNLNRFSGNELLNISTDYEYTYRNLHFFGETAMSDNRGLATLNGLLVTTGKAVDFTILQRYFSTDFQTVAGNAFGETRNVNNESGVFLGIQIYFNQAWKMSAYFDNWQHKWLKFNIDAPSVGSEYLVQLNYRPSRGTEMYLRYRNETKERNATNSETAINYLISNQKTQFRFHLSSKLTPAFTIKSRVEFARFYNGIDAPENGFLVYQDLAYNGRNFRFSTRFALFDTETYNARIYAYESDLLYNFSIPAYYYKGSRFYLNCRYNFSKYFLLEARFSRTTFYNRDFVGSALEMIEGSSRSEIKMQARVRF
jgi:hypothetical protein